MRSTEQRARQIEAELAAQRAAEKPDEGAQRDQLRQRAEMLRLELASSRAAQAEPCNEDDVRRHAEALQQEMIEQDADELAEAQAAEEALLRGEEQQAELGARQTAWTLGTLFRMTLWGLLGAAGSGFLLGVFDAVTGSLVFYLLALAFFGAATGCSVASAVRKSEKAPHGLLGIWGLLCGLAGAYVYLLTSITIATRGETSLLNMQEMLEVLLEGLRDSESSFGIGFLLVCLAGYIVIAAAVAEMKMSFQSLGWSLMRLLPMGRLLAEEELRSRMPRRVRREGGKVRRSDSEIF